MYEFLFSSYSIDVALEKASLHAIEIIHFKIEIRTLKYN